MAVLFTLVSFWLMSTEALSSAETGASHSSVPSTVALLMTGPGMSVDWVVYSPVVVAISFGAMVVWLRLRYSLILSSKRVKLVMVVVPTFVTT